MKKIIFTSMLCMLAVPAMADVASTAYVGAVKTNLESAIDLKLSKAMDAKGAAVVTNASGAAVTGSITQNMIDDGAVTNSKVASGISMDKLNLPTKCTNGDCMLVYNADDKEFDWMSISR